MIALLQDLQYGLRMLRKNPAVASIALITLALGIGANTAIFSVVNAVLWRPLAYQNPEQLVAVWETNASAGTVSNSRNEVAMANFLDWRAEQSVFTEIAALTYSNVNLTGGVEPERVQGAVVTTNLFQVLGINPNLGRSFLPDEEIPGSSRVVILSNGFWQRRFGSDPGLLGTTVILDGNPTTVVGILPPSFELQFPANMQIEMWLPMRIDPAKANRQSHYLYVLGRLKPGVTIEESRSGMNLLASQLGQQYPATNAEKGANVIPLHTQLIGNVRPYLYLLLGAVGFVLLIACANVANLLLARVAARQKEMSIRVALGASRSRIIRQLLTESLLLSALGGIFGLLLARWGIDLLVALTPPDVPRLGEIRLHTEVFAWTLAISVITGVLFGLAPALQASRTNLNESLKESVRSTGSPHRSRVRDLLVISEVALALVLLIGAGLMIRSFSRLQQVSPGFETKNLLTMSISLPRQKYSKKPQVNSFYDQLFERLRALPGVDSVGGIDPLPMSGSNGTTGFVIAGGPTLAVADRPEVGERTITPDYFQAMRIPLLRGRAFTSLDREDAPRVVVVSEALAKRFWPDGDALGKRLGFRESEPQVWHEIIGIAGDVKHDRLDADTKPELYFPYGQYPGNFMSLVIRTAGEPATMNPEIRKQVLAIDGDQPVFDIKTMDERLSKTLASSRFIMLMLGAFALVSAILAAVGIYGVMAYVVTSRTHEMGVRMALGAQGSDVLRMVVGQAMGLVGVGVMIGLGAAFVLTRLMSSLLFEVKATDPGTFVAVSVGLVVVALMASLIPARRATQVDPIVALRYE